MTVQVFTAAHSDSIGKKLCKLLDLDPMQVTDIQIKVMPHHPVEVTVTRLVDAQAIDSFGFEEMLDGLTSHDFDNRPSIRVWHKDQGCYLDEFYIEYGEFNNAKVYPTWLSIDNGKDITDEVEIRVV